MREWGLVDETAEVTQAITQLLARHKSLEIATTGGPVSPWVAGAFFAEAGLFRLKLVLETRGKTLANVTANNRIAVIVSADNPFTAWAQAQGTAHVVDGDDDAAVRAALARRCRRSSRSSRLRSRPCTSSSRTG